MSQQNVSELVEQIALLRHAVTKESKKFRMTIVFQKSLDNAASDTLKYKVTFPFRITKITLLCAPSATVTANFDYGIQCLGSPVWKYPDAGQKLIRVYEGQKIEFACRKNFQKDTELECYMLNNYGATIYGQAIVEIEEL